MNQQSRTAKQDSARPGRPRDAGASREILKATIHLLANLGYAGVSIERVAAEAGVGKTTIYRRYSSKDELVVAALESFRADIGSPPDTGSARADIVEMALQTQTALRSGPGLPLIGALLVEERRNPRLFNLVREQILRPRRDDLIAILGRGVNRGEVREDIDLELAAHAIMGLVLTRQILDGPEPKEQLEEAIDTVWRGLQTYPNRP